MSQADVILQSAKLRLDRATREFRRTVWGDAEYWAEVRSGYLADAMAKADAKPAPEVRRKLRPNWAWWKRLRGK